MNDHFDRWLAKHDAEVRADEREKAAQRVYDQIATWPESISDLDWTTINTTVDAARSGEQE